MFWVTYDIRSEIQFWVVAAICWRTDILQDSCGCALSATANLFLQLHIVDTEIKVPSDDIPSLKPGVGQNIALHVFHG